MKKLVLTALVALTLAPQVQSQPISKFRYVKECALGYWDLLFGKFYLTRNNNFQKNFVKGFEDTQWWKKNLEQRAFFNKLKATKKANAELLEFLTLNCIQ